jgi:two-component system, OmpR family, response regulator QseB
MRARILYISEYEGDGRRLAQTLHTLRLVVDHVSTLREAGLQLQQEEYDVILTEAAVPDGNWLDVLHLARKSSRELRVVITDSHADACFRAQALDMGAYDLLTQPSCEPVVRRILFSACSTPLCEAVA